MNKLSRRFSGNWAKSLRNSRKSQHRRRLMAEQLEDRRLLAVDINVFHNYASPTDANVDGNVSPVDALVVINHINAASAAGEGEDGAPTTSAMKPDVNGDGHISPLDVLNIINDLAEGEHGAVVNFTFQATDLAGNPITSVGVGEDFILQTLVQDSRAAAQGVFAAYFDLDYDEGLVSFNRRESQTLQFAETPTGGTYRLMFNSQTTADITFADRDPALPPPFNTDPNIVAALNARRIEEALLALPGMSIGDIEVVPFTGGTVDGGSRFNFEIKFGGQFANQDVASLVPTQVALTNAASNPNTPTATILDTCDDLLVPAGAANRDMVLSACEFTRSITFAFPKYSSGHSGADGEVSSQTGPNRIIDEVGAFTSNQTPDGGDMQVLLEVQMRANAGGTATFIGDPADNAPDHDTLVFGLDNAVAISDLGFHELNLSISSVLAAVDDPVTVTEGSGATAIDVLANDTSVNGTKVITGIDTTGTSGTVTFTQTGVTYQPPASFSGQTTFTYSISNNAGATATATVTVNVTPVNDAPTITAPGSLTVVEDMTLNISGVSVDDADGNDVTVTLAVSNGNLTAGAQSGASISLSGTLASVNTSLGGLTYTPNANVDTSDTLVIGVTDGIIANPVTRSVPINITAVNDPTVLTVPGDQTAFLGSDLVFSAANMNAIAVTDPDSTLTVTLTVGQGNLAAGGQSGSSITLSGNAATITSQLDGLIYSFISTTPFSTTLDVTAQNGATLQESIGITIAPPTTPFAANNSFTFAEDSGAQMLNVLGNDIAEDGNTLAITELGVGAQTVTPGNSTTVANGTLQGTLALAANGTDVTFTPAANANGNFSFTYTIVQSPNAGDMDAVRTATVAVTVTPVNDAPTLNVPGAQTVAEDNTLNLSGLTVADIDGDTLTVTLGVSNGSLTSAAPLAQSGSSLTLTGSVANINTALAGLTYNPSANFNGSETLTVSVNDGNGGTASGSVGISVTAVNDDPTLTVPGPQQFFRDISNSLTSPISIADIDAGSSDVRVNLTIGAGTLAVSQTSGVQVASITGGISLTGSIANVNAALASLTYTNSVSGDFTLTIAANDLGNTGSGGGQDVTATVAVKVLDFVPAMISGHVYLDVDGDNQRDSGETGVGNIEVTLTGTDFRGNAINLMTTTRADGSYSFDDVPPNQTGQPYVVTQQQSSFLLGNASTASVNLDLQGNTAVTGNLNFAQTAFVNEFENVFNLFALSGQEPSGVLFGINGNEDFSMLLGEWANGRYSNVRFVPSADGNAATLTVFDSQLGVDRVANVSTAAGNLTYRGTGSARIYRVVGGPSLLNAANSEGEGSQSSSASSGDATSDGAAYARGVDSIFANGGV